MKKLLSVLLVLLVVGGMAFGATDEAGGTATLTLGATQTAKTVHGFGNTAYTTFGAILNANEENPTALADNSKTELNLESDDAQSVGYYTFASNLSRGVTVSFVANPLTATIGEDVHYVPYKISWTKSAGTVTVVDSNIDLGITPAITDSKPSTTPIAASASTTVFNSATPTGPKWAQLSLSVYFNGTGNTAYGLPAVAFQGSVVATIAAK